MTGVQAQAPPSRVIRPRKRWTMVHPSELWEFRSLLVRLAARDITLRYRQTALGAIWVILQPLLGAGILSFVFGNVAGLPAPAGIPYFLFSLVGMVGWTAFSQIATRSSSSLVSNAPLIQKVFFPRLLLPVSTALSTMVDVGVSLGLVAVLLVVYGVAPGAAIITFPIWLLLFVLIGLGLGLISSALMVPYRDVQYVLPVAVQMLLFLSPVAYSLQSVPKGSRFLYELNPLAGLLEGFRWAVLDTPAPPALLIAYSASMSIVLFVVGLLVFHRMERGFADVI
jgi:lipopolysaccharide transport system permease protein